METANWKKSVCLCLHYLLTDIDSYDKKFQVLGGIQHIKGFYLSFFKYFEKFFPIFFFYV